MDLRHFQNNHRNIKKIDIVALFSVTVKKKKLKEYVMSLNSLLSVFAG